MEKEPKYHPETTDKATWETMSQEARRIRDDIVYKELDRLYGEEKFIKWLEIQNSLIDKLQKSGLSDEEQQEYAAFHIVIGSSPSYEHSPKFDLPGDLSIMAFLQQKLQELKSTN